MAYGNWGAFVYKNGERQRNREDATPWREDDEVSGYHQAFKISIGRDGQSRHDPTLSAHHAVLGSGNVRLCGYKDDPVLYVNGVRVPLKTFESDGERVECMGGQLHTGHEWSADLCDNFVDLYMKDPNGDVWTSRCGYMMGAGHDDDD